MRQLYALNAATSNNEMHIINGTYFDVDAPLLESY